MPTPQLRDCPKCKKRNGIHFEVQELPDFLSVIIFKCTEKDCRHQVNKLEDLK